MLTPIAALLLAAVPTRSQVFVDLPLQAPSAGALPAIVVPASPDALEPLPAGRGLLAGPEGELPSVPLPPAAEPSRESARSSDAAAPDLTPIFDKLLRRDALTPAEKNDFDSLMEATTEIAFDSRRSYDDRLQAVVLITQAGLLSIHDLSTRRMAEDRLIRLKFSLCQVRKEAEDGYRTLLKHAFAGLHEDTRRFIHDSLVRSPLLH
jgi:hypothetical protein